MELESILRSLSNFREEDCGECPYLPGRRWVRVAFTSTQVPPTFYQYLLDAGWRRSGLTFYRNACPGCDACKPLRVDCDAFRPNRSQRRTLARNADLAMDIRPVAPRIKEFLLYKRYKKARHPPRSPSEDDEDNASSFVYFFCANPVDAKVIHHSMEGCGLVIAAWTDILPACANAVYTAYDPGLPSRGLGVYSILKQIELCRGLGLRWLHLGFHVAGCRAMSYKSLYAPFETLGPSGWTPGGGGGGGEATPGADGGV